MTGIVLSPQIKKNEFSINHDFLNKYANIEVMIDLIEEKYHRVFTNYSELADKININFCINISTEDIIQYYEKYYDVDIKDKELITKNLNILY